MFHDLSNIDEEYIDSCVKRLAEKYMDAFGDPKAKIDTEGLWWTFAGICCREGQQGCEDVIRSWQYIPTPRRFRAYA